MISHLINEQAKYDAITDAEKSQRNMQKYPLQIDLAGTLEFSVCVCVTIDCV